MIFIRLITSFCSRLNLRQKMALGSGIGWFLGSFIRHRRAEVRRTIRRCLPEKSESEIRAIADGMYRHLGRFIVESAGAEILDRQFVQDNVEIIGLEIVTKLLAGGKGVIALTAHIGNFDLLAIICCLTGIPLTSISKKLKPKALDDYWVATRKKHGLKPIPTRHSFRSCISALRRNEILAFFLDQNMKRNRGIFVDFFGRKACTSPGLAQLSALCGSPVMPVFITRTAQGGHRVEILPPLDPPAENTPEAFQQATQQYTRIIEDYIRRYPEQWIWLHRRWRTRPIEEMQDAATSSRARSS